MALSWDSTFCWQVIKANTDQKEKITIKDPAAVELNTLNVLVTLCASDDKERQAWMNAIDNFHTCEVKVITTVDN